MERRSGSGPEGYLSLVLHAHLPYIRYPEHENHLEERWLFEAITETYIPILHMLERLLDDGIDFRITLSFSPPLVAMFSDNMLMERYGRYLSLLIELSEKEVFRTRGNSALAPIAAMYRQRFLQIRRLFEESYRRDLTASFASLCRSEKIEIMTSTATHAYLPALLGNPLAVSAQLDVGTAYFRKQFGRGSNGIWLPECGYHPGIDSLVRESGITYFFLESHGLLGAVPSPQYSIYAPVTTPGGAYAFARDAESSKQVWSSIGGYPGDVDYRDFYRDIGFDLDFEYMKPYLPDGIRTFTGIKYYRVTGRSGDKAPYLISRAKDKAGMHAEHFIEAKHAQTLLLREKLGRKPIITAAYDMELFGHWWFEGPLWLDHLLRKGALDSKAFRFTAPTEYLAEHPEAETVMPSPSSWGDKGYHSTWINNSNDWTYRHLHRAANAMTETACQHLRATGITERALNQAARELLLSQASDWAFMMKTGNAREFSMNKFREHMKNFFVLHKGITSGMLKESTLSALEQKNNIFPEINYRMFCSLKGKSS